MAPEGSAAPCGAGPNFSDRPSSASVESAKKSTTELIAPLIVESPRTRLRLNCSTWSGGTKEIDPEPTHAMAVVRPATGVS